MNKTQRFIPAEEEPVAPRLRGIEPHLPFFLHFVLLPLLQLHSCSSNSNMAPSRSSRQWLSSLLAFLTILSLSLPANALYFYMDGQQTRCFFEDLPKDTLVVGMYIPTIYLPPAQLTNLTV